MGVVSFTLRSLYLFSKKFWEERLKASFSKKYSYKEKERAKFYICHIF